MIAPVMSLAVALGAAATAKAAIHAEANVVYARVDGRPLTLDVCTPEGPGPFAAVILVHGGAFKAGSKRGDPRPLQAPLTAAGLAWFSIDYRLAPKYHFPAPVEDVQTAIRWVKANAARYHVDPRRLALLGESAGGQLVTMVAVQDEPGTRVAAVVDFYGPTDFVLQAREHGRLGSDMVALFGRTALDEPMLRAMREGSPVNFVRPDLPPFLIVHGTADRVVCYDESVELASRLRANGVPCELLTIRGGFHAMANWAKVDPGFKTEVVAWLVKRLRASGPLLAASRAGPMGAARPLTDGRGHAAN